MNKTEILNIVNEPSKHIQIVKIDGKDSIAYSSKFVELLELIPTMLTKADMVDMLTEIQKEIKELNTYDIERTHGLIEDAYVTTDVSGVIQRRIDDVLKKVDNGNDDW